MRFFRRALAGLFLTALTLGLLVAAGATIQGALEARRADGGAPAPARERSFAAEVAPLTFGTQTPTLTAFGEVRARRTLELRAPAEGTVSYLAAGFEEGGAVTAGQVLLRIDPSEAQAALDTARADLQDAGNELAEAVQALDLARDDVAAAQAQADLRRRALNRQLDLEGRGVGSASAVETAELALAGADQMVLSRRQALAQAEARVAQAETGLERRRIALAEAERALDRTVLRAEFDGVLAEVGVVAGGLVTRNEQVARLIDPDALEIAFQVPTVQYGQLLGPDGSLPAAPVRVMLDGFGLEIAAEGVLVRESGSVAAGQTGRLLFAALDAAGGLRAGDVVRVEVAESPLDGVARLPATALGSDGQILVLGAEDRLEAVAVQLVRRQGDDVLVRADAAVAGREVVLARTPLLGAGIRVTPIRPEAAMPAPETLTLDPDRRARLIAHVEADTGLPAEVRARMIEQLRQDAVPAGMVNRLESRMGS